MKISRRVTLVGVTALLAGATAALSGGPAPAASSVSAASPAIAAPPVPTFSTPAAFDVSPPLRDLAKRARPVLETQLPPERGPAVTDTGFTGDGAVQQGGAARSLVTPSIPSPLLTFEGLRNTDNPFLVA